MSNRPKVLVSGCYDLLHGGHVVFFETAAQYGEVYVCVGSDASIESLKHHQAMFNQDERRYIVDSIKFVKEARISAGVGMLDFEQDMKQIQPDIFIVNEDGHVEAKRELCAKYGVEYKVLPRVPRPGLPSRSSTDLKAGKASKQLADLEATLPYRLCLAGGGLEQPWVSKHHAGPVITVNIHPTRPFNLRSGMAASSREVWKRIAPSGIFDDDPIELAKLLFGYENPPGSKYITGSQNHLGLTLPGINRLDYDGEYWPAKIDTIADADTCDWLERALVLVELFERPDGDDPLAQQNLTKAGVGRLAEAAECCWEGIAERDIAKLGRGLTGTQEAWAEILPLTTNERIEAEMSKYECFGRLTSDCGGGHLVMAAERDIPGGFRPRLRRQLGETLAAEPAAEAVR